MFGRLATALLYALASTFVEKKVLPSIGWKGFLEEPSPLLNLPRAYGLLMIILGFTYIWVLMLGMKVSQARNKYLKLAEKDGEKDVQERYAYPNLYAQGTTKNVRAFNCVQRSHQQVLETFTGYIMTALFAGLEFPITASIFCTLWLYSRSLWVSSYAESEGDPSKRYDKPFSSFFWNAMLVLWMTCNMSAVSMLLGRSIFWDSIIPGDLF
ncbi:MAPEG family protein [Nitzschia inconspicua]|uniref:MAPEG family protein n=1 Tax=Nitzschia inconspicua TaxID=303405 RepID=A0A9K3KB42_9STRA|nr:MAPEG family protein [Nitzschia inconspicua]